MGGIDGIILCAGVVTTGVFLRQPLQVAHKMIETNVGGALNCINHALPTLIRIKSSFVITFSSVAVERPTAGMAAYSASKGAVEALSRALAAEYLSRGVHFICIRLGPTDTDMWRGTHMAKSPKVAERLPNGPMSPTCVADFVTTLIATPLQYLNGNIIRFDCGFCLT